MKNKNKTITFDAGNLYDANKQLIQQTCKPLTLTEIDEKQIELIKWFKDIQYAMLLCHDIRYFTVFILKHEIAEESEKAAAHEVIGCLEDQEGEILSMELQKDNAWEIWLKKDDKVMAFYLFNYKQGIIKC